MSIGRTNSGSGGGGGISPINAVIHVTAKTGSTIAFSFGGVIVKTLDGSKGIPSASESGMSDYFYSVSSNNYGAWTVTATYGENYEKSESVTVSTNAVYDVYIAYNLWVYRSGRYFESMLGEARRKNSSATSTTKVPTISEYGNYFNFFVSRASGCYRTRDLINVTPYTKLRCEYANSTSNAIIASLFNSTYYGISGSTGAAVEVDLSSSGTATADISSVSGNYYISIGGSWASGDMGADIYGLWLER